jgi:hypothetical protein
LDYAIVKFETLGALVGPKEPDHSRLADPCSAKCYCHGNLVNGVVADFISQVNNRQFYRGEDFAVGTYCASTGNCDVMVELKEGRNGNYAVFSFKAKPGKTKSVDDPFQVVVSRHQRVVHFSKKPSIVERFPLARQAVSA